MKSTSLISRSLLLTALAALSLLRAPTARSAEASTLATSPYYMELVAQAARLGLAKQPHWLKLLHYMPKTFGGIESQVAGMEFFLAADGKTSPESELNATLLGFFDPIRELPNKKQHPQCQFPARYLWLNEQLKFDPLRLSKVPCPRFEQFREKIAAKSATVIFSSYYLNNPSSAFGHTLIRLNKSPSGAEGKRHELLDYGISYAAVMDTSNVAVYAFKAMSGMFQGTFTSIPYYYKVREYNDFESRDLWEYDLKLTQPQVDLMVAHFWELGSTHFDYYYLTQNCAYHVLSTIEAANPELDLVSKLPSIVIPADTIKILSREPGLITGVNYRPSLRKQFTQRAQDLDAEELAALREWTQTHDPATIPSSFAPARRAQVLDAAADYLDLHYNRELLLRNSEHADWNQKLLLARSRLSLASQELVVQTPWSERPDQGHGTRRLGFFGGYDRGLSTGYAEINYRFALHDLLDPLTGFPDYAEIQFFNLSLRAAPAGAGQNGHVWADDLRLFQVVSLTPFDGFTRNFSWKLNFGGRRFHDPGCEYYHCVGPDFELGGGYALSLSPGRSLTGFVFADYRSEAAVGFNGPHWRNSAGPLVGLRWHAGTRLTALAQATYQKYLYGGQPDPYLIEGGMRWAANNDFAVGVKGEARRDSREGSLGIYYYY